MNINNAIAGAVVLLCGGLLAAGVYYAEPVGAPVATRSDFADFDERADLVRQADDACEGLDLPIDVSGVEPAVMRDRRNPDCWWVQYSDDQHTVSVHITQTGPVVYADGVRLTPQEATAPQA